MPPELGPAATISRRPQDRDSPLSFAQQRLWFLDQLEPGRPTYNSPLALRLEGRLVPGALADAVTAIVARHEALRTTFATRDGIPVQIVHPPAPVAVPEIDLTDVAAGEREAALARRLAEEAARPFDLTRDSMLRAALFRLGPEHHALLLVLHHIATDGWSTGLLVGELAELYNAAHAGRAPRLAPLPIQYADYAVWQRSWLQGEVLERQLAYWKAKLAGAPTVLDLPLDRPRPPIQGGPAASHPVTLPRPLTDALKALGRQHRVTLFMTLLAAWQILLARYSRQEDILIGAPIAGRTRVQTEPVIGFFVNTLVMRTSLAGDPTVGELLQGVRSVCVEAYAHQELPFEKLVEELHPERNRSHPPLVQAVLAFDNTPAPAVSFDGLRVSRLPTEPVLAKFDLVLSLTTDAGALVGHLRYDASLFEAATIARMGSHFETLVQEMVADPDRPCSRLPLVGEEERVALLAHGARTEREYPRDARVHELFRAQAARTPDAIAVVCGDRSLTYRALEGRANQLAQFLRRAGVGAETPVALLVERSLEMILGVLGVLKAGGAYVPLDSAAPADRLRYLLEDIGAPVILTQAHLAARVPEVPGTLVRLDTDWADIAAEPDTPPADETTAESLAAVMYTSGSTGRPKGVSVPHRAIVRLVVSTTYVRWSADEVFLQLAPLAFDASTFEIWGSLLHGARLVMFPPGPLSLAALGETLVRSKVTTLWLTAGLFHQVVDDQLPSLAGVRQLLAGGDVVSLAHVRRVLAAHPGMVVINGYGPTEGTTFTCCHQITDPATLGASVPIGRPLENTRVYILDRHAEPCPVGVPGELHIAGDGLARGYWNDPELTAARFYVRSVGDRRAERLYRSGDLARYRADGAIEFLGRLDEQVKIRGHRVEPVEIENALTAHPAVREAVVVAREHAGDRQLVAYVAPAPGHTVTDGALKSHLRRTLPDYMVPDLFVALDTLPLTPNGKVDRLALPAPAAPGHAAPGAPPLSPEERKVRDIWQRVLHHNDVGVDDDFFDVGGHSLLATQLLSRLEAAFDRRLPLSVIFEASTIRQQAALLRKDLPITPARVVPLQAAGSRPPLFFIDAVPLFRSLAGRLGPDQPFLALPHPPVALLSHPFSLGEIAAYHVATIRAAWPTGPYLIAGWSAGGVVAFEVARQLRAAGGDVVMVALLEASPPEFYRQSWTRLLESLSRRSRFHAGRVVRLTWPEMLPYVTARVRTLLRALGSSAWRHLYRASRQLGVDPRARFQSREQAVLFALSTYHPEPYAGPVLFFRSADRLACFGGTLDFGWGKFVQGGIESYVVPGDHISLLEEPNVKELAEHLEAFMERPGLNHSAVAG